MDLNQQPSHLVLDVWPEGANGLSSPPDFLVVDFGKFLGEIFTVGLPAIELEGLAGLRSILHALVELLEDRGVSLLENGSPIKSTATGSGGAGIVHVVHANHQMHKCLVDRRVEIELTPSDR